MNASKRGTENPTFLACRAATRRVSRIRRPVEAPPAWKRGVVVLAAANLALLVAALLMGGGRVRDGAGDVTNGWIVAGGIVATLAAAFALRWAPLPPWLIARIQALALLAQILHALGHLARFYYSMWWYDDLLHAGLVFAIGLALVEVGRLMRPPFGRLPAAAFAAMILVGAVAAAGLWEIFEYAMDVAFSTREQDDLRDTMQDMLDGLLGGAIAAAVAAREVRVERQAQPLADARSDELLD